MRTRILLFSSLALNVLLVLMWLGGRGDRIPIAQTDEQLEAPSSDVATTNIIVRRQFFSWTQLESDDYTRYIANLRSVGCPEPTIRDIIVADVNELFAKRCATETLPIIRQWWQSQPDPDLMTTAYRQRHNLELERQSMLTSLLGPDWDVSEADSTVMAFTVPLDGPLLGTLSEKTKQKIQEVNGRAQARFERILAASSGDPDPSALASLESWLSTELAPLMSSAQLEEFMFRYAPSSQALRLEFADLRLFNATPIELRTVYRNVQPIDLQLMSLQGDSDNTVAQRQGLMRQREIAVQNALGPARYRDYVRLKDPTYQKAAAVAQDMGISNAADLFYLIDQLGAEEQASINADPNLSPLQRELAARQIEVEQLQVAAEALGEATPPEPPIPPQRTYNFQKGDNIAEVSMRTGVPVALILRANPGLEPGQIQPGTQIIIPDRTAPFP